MSNSLKNRAHIYDKLHRFGVLVIFGVSFATIGLIGYNVYLFKREGVPMILNKYRAKIEEQIELKQREAEYLEHLKRSESEIAKKE